jgi:hypothetical protein
MSFTANGSHLYVATIGLPPTKRCLQTTATQSCAAVFALNRRNHSILRYIYFGLHRKAVVDADVSYMMLANAIVEIRGKHGDPISRSDAGRVYRASGARPNQSNPGRAPVGRVFWRIQLLRKRRTHNATNARR